MPKFKSWLSPTSWSHWEKFLARDLAKLSRIPTCSSESECPLLVLDTTCQREMEVDVEACANGEESYDGGKDLEDMLDKERIPVVVCTLASYYVHSAYSLQQLALAQHFTPW